MIRPFSAQTQTPPRPRLVGPTSFLCGRLSPAPSLAWPSAGSARLKFERSLPCLADPSTSIITKASPMAASHLPFPSPNSCCGFTVFARLAYIYCGERHSRSQRPENQRDDRKADFRCGPNPQRGEPSCRSRPRISSPSHAFSPPAISGCRDRRRRDIPLDSPAKSSPDGHVVNDSEKGDSSGNRD